MVVKINQSVRDSSKNLVNNILRDSMRTKPDSKPSHCTLGHVF